MGERVTLQQVLDAERRWKAALAHYYADYSHQTPAAWRECEKLEDEYAKLVNRLEAQRMRREV